MCGICGFVDEQPREVLVGMCDALAHRGPDAQGHFQDGMVQLGHRRLSIVDLEQGNQPTFNEDARIALVFNGEIYNHPQLRPQLEKAGHIYRTHSDTESIVHAYEEFGTGCVEHLDGMFAFVLYDRRNRLLFGARDRFGKKPLYYCQPKGDNGEPRFVFASELKSLRQHPAVAGGCRIDEHALCDYLLNDYVVASRSIFEGICRLPAGSAFVYGLPGSAEPGFRSWRYWDIDLTPSSGPFPSLDEAADRVLELLAEGVQKRLMADVPLGAFLSGGIDSSALVAILTRFLEPDRIKTFSIAFDERSFDESHFAQEVADYYGTTHHVRRFSSRDMLDQLPAVVGMLDEPFADPSILPVSMLCQFARERVTVALGGDGGDELFAGYDPFRAISWADRLQGPLLRPALPSLAGLSRMLPTSTRNMSLQFKAKRFLRGLDVDPSLRLPLWMGAFTPQLLGQIAPGLMELLGLDDVFVCQQNAARSVKNRGGNSVDVALDFFERFYLCDDILVKVDRGSMMHSLEVRAPFLDQALAEYVNRLPVSMKLAHGETKRVLKHALCGRGRKQVVPRHIVHRKKKGFGIPVAHWIRHDLRDHFHEMLIGNWPNRLVGFDRSQIAELLHRHVQGRENNYKELWALFMLSHWAHRHFA